MNLKIDFFENKTWKCALNCQVKIKVELWIKGKKTHDQDCAWDECSETPRYKTYVYICTHIYICRTRSFVTVPNVRNQLFNYSPHVGYVGTTTGRMRMPTTHGAYKSRHLGAPWTLLSGQKKKPTQKIKKKERAKITRGTGLAAKYIIEWKRGEQRQKVVLSIYKKKEKKKNWVGVGVGGML